MKPMKILVVDDSNITIKKLTLMLEELGHMVVRAARTGEDAVRLFDDFRPDLVTMDITMPDMDGIEATKRIMAVDPKALVVMVTSHGQEQMVIDAVEAGAKGYVLKPFKRDKLQETITKITEKYLVPEGG